MITAEQLQYVVDTHKKYSLFNYGVNTKDLKTEGKMKMLIFNPFAHDTKTPVNEMDMEEYYERLKSIVDSKHDVINRIVQLMFKNNG